MASQKTSSKRKKLNKKSVAASAKKATGAASKKKNGSKRAVAVRKVKSRISATKTKKRSSTRSATAKKSKPIGTNKAKSGVKTRTVAMVRRAASAPASSRKAKSTATAGTAKKQNKMNKPAIPSKTPKAGSTTPTVAAEEPKLTPADLEYFRGLLLEKRRELLGDMGSMESHAFNSDGGHSSSPIHMADVGSDNFEQEFTLGLLESERQTLREIHEAIERVDNGTFGICVATGKPIGRARLEAKPWAKYCIEYARQLERGQNSRAAEVNNHHHEDEDEDD